MQLTASTAPQRATSGFNSCFTTRCLESKTMSSRLGSSNPGAGGRVIGGLVDHSCRIWNTGSRPIHDLEIVLQLERDGERLTAIGRGEEILEEQSDTPLWRPGRRIHSTRCQERGRAHGPNQSKANRSAPNYYDRAWIARASGLEAHGCRPSRGIAARGGCGWVWDDAPPVPKTNRERRPGLLGAAAMGIYRTPR